MTKSNLLKHTKHPHLTLPKSKYLRVIIISFGILFFIGCSKTIISHSVTQPICIDGLDSEWSLSKFTPIDDQSTYSIMNDDSTLFMIFKTSNRDYIRQIISSGLEIWFNPGGKKRSKLGFQYLGVGKTLTARGFETRGERPEFRTDNPDERIRKLLQLPLAIGVLNNDGPIDRIMPEDSSGVQIKSDYMNGVFTCEMRIPLYSNAHNPYAAIANGHKKIDLEINTETRHGEHDRGEFRGRGPGGGGFGEKPGGERGERPGGLDTDDLPGKMRPGGMRPGREGRFQQPKTLEVQVQIKLAETGSS